MNRCLNCGNTCEENLCQVCKDKLDGGIILYCEKCDEYHNLHERCSCERQNEKSCEICGRPCQTYDLCPSCNNLKKDGEIIQCKECKAWHFKEDYTPKEQPKIETNYPTPQTITEYNPPKQEPKNVVYNTNTNTNTVVNKRGKGCLIAFLIFIAIIIAAIIIVISLFERILSAINAWFWVTTNITKFINIKL